MKVSELQSDFIDNLKTQLPEWKYVKSQRVFKKPYNNVTWFIHVSCINHPSDFDAVCDIAVEYKSGKERVCIVGAEIGNIIGTGQQRFAVSNTKESKIAAIEFFSTFNAYGMPFLLKYSEVKEVVNSLEKGGKEAMLISPILNLHKQQISKLKDYGEIGI